MRARCSAPYMNVVTRVMSRLERQALQVEHQLGVVVEPLRHADAGPLVLRQRRLGVLRLGLLDAALDLAQHVEIVGDRRAIRRTELRPQAGHLLDRRVEDAVLRRGPPPPAARPDRRRRTAARTRAAGCSASAAASSATPTRAWCRRRSCSRYRSRRSPSSAGSRARATAAACPS